MTVATLEHVNLTVQDAHKTAKELCRFFDWRIRWQGKAMAGGYTYHVGNDDSYLAVYMYKDGVGSTRNDPGPLNHVAIQVDDLEEVEARVKFAGYLPHNYGDYEPGRRFYFHDQNGIEFEIVSYSPKLLTRPLSWQARMAEMAKAGMIRN